MNPTLRSAGVLLALMLAAGPARPADNAALGAAARQLQSAVNHAKPDELLKARGAFQALLLNDPKSATLHYWVALANWRAVPIVANTDKERAKQMCKDGIAAADRAIAIDPKLAEAHAIRAGLLGMTFLFNPSLGPTLGPEIEEGLGRAQALAPENPRVALLAAMSTLNKPAFVGGGAVKAQPQLKRTVELFAAAHADSSGLSWGRDDALLWAGRAALELKDSTGAVELYRQALVVNPDNAWVHYVLLPQAKQTVPDSTKASTP